jgi:hypothetical protein
MKQTDALIHVSSETYTPQRTNEYALILHLTTEHGSGEPIAKLIMCSLESQYGKQDWSANIQMRPFPNEREVA